MIHWKAPSLFSDHAASMNLTHKEVSHITGQSTGRVSDYQHTQGGWWDHHCPIGSCCRPRPCSLSIVLHVALSKAMEAADQ